MYELWLRLREPLNTFWLRFRNWFLGLGILAGTVTDFIRLFLDDPLIPDEWRPWLRVVYGIMFFAALQAQMTVRDPESIKHKKEFNEKIEDHG